MSSVDTVQSLILNFLEFLHNIENLVRSIDLVSRTGAISQCGIYNFLLEIPWDRIVTHRSTHQSHHNRTSYLWISSPFQNSHQTLHEISACSIDFNAGVGKRCFKLAQITSAGDLNPFLNSFPQLHQLWAAIIVDPFGCMKESIARILFYEHISQQFAINNWTFHNKLIGAY